MTGNDMQMMAVALIHDYVVERFDKSDPHYDFTVEDVYVVWFSKTLQNWKALVSTTLPDGMYYEVTHDGNLERTYIDAYKKFDNVVVQDKGWEGR
jgi:uncharacterized protein DUF6275